MSAMAVDHQSDWLPLDQEPLADQEEWESPGEGGACLDPSGQDRARLKRVRDYLIDAEDELTYVVKRDRTLVPMMDAVVAMLMDLTRRIER